MRCQSFILGFFFSKKKRFATLHLDVAGFWGLISN